MQWSWQVARIARSPRSRGIAVRVHVTLLLLLVLLAVASWRDGSATFALTAAVFLAVLLHELGHALAARQFGIETLEIILLPIGGVSRMERAASSPWDEAVIALAGPFVNLALASLLAVLLALYPSTWLYQGVMLNLVLGLFNLIPAFPMDGGRVLRGALWSRTSYLRATRLAARVGRVLALCFIAVGFAQSVLLVIIGAFILASSSAEEQLVEMSTLLKDVRVEEVCHDEWVPLRAGDTVSAAAAQLWAQRRPCGLVMRAGRPCGVITAAALAAAVDQQGPATPVDAVMQGPVHCVPASARMGDVFRLFEGAAVVVVDESGRIVGVLTPSHLSDILSLRRVLDRSGAAVPLHHGLPTAAGECHPPLCISGGGGRPVS